MRSASTLRAALWPALLGVLAAHEVAYAGHDDGHLHGYLETVGPAVVVAAVLGWIWSWARSTVDFRTVLATQTALFVVMEVSERAAGSVAFSPADLAPLFMGLAILPLVSAVSVIADRFDEVFLWCRSARSWPLVRSDSVVDPDLAPEPGSHTIWSIRAPPALA